MPRSNRDQVPAAYVTDGTWPHAQLALEAPVSASYGQALARNLMAALQESGLGQRSLAIRAGVAHTTISRVLRGEVLPDIGTLARLEAALGAELWPGLSAIKGTAAYGVGHKPVDPAH